nr:uncharacterized protein LOC109178670 [Ipomoea batatas]
MGGRRCRSCLPSSSLLYTADVGKDRRCIPPCRCHLPPLWETFTGGETLKLPRLCRAQLPPPRITVEELGRGTAWHAIGGDRDHRRELPLGCHQLPRALLAGNRGDEFRHRCRTMLPREEEEAGSGSCWKKTDFEQCLDTEINNVGKLDISDAQLIFFGIYWHNHFYIMCYNFTTSMLEIIDNRPLPKGMRIQQKYADSPKVLDPYLASLRALYTSRILMMPVNVHKATVIRNVEEHFIGKRLLQ